MIEVLEIHMYLFAVDNGDRNMKTRKWPFEGTQT